MKYVRNIVDTVRSFGSMFIGTTTHESGVTTCTEDEAWSAYVRRQASVSMNLQRSLTDFITYAKLKIKTRINTLMGRSNIYI